MTVKPVAGAVRASRRRPAAVPAPATPPKLDPARIAFMGSAQQLGNEHNPVYVQAWCWPIVPTAWAVLTQSWEAVRVGRGEYKSTPTTAALPPSWIRACAPQLGAPFRDSTAEESSVAALVTRAPIEISVSVIDTRKRAEPSGTRAHVEADALSSCLGHYSKAMRARKRAPCAMLFSRSQGAATDEQLQKEFAQSRAMLSEADALDAMNLLVWQQPREPLPLELANVIAAAVLRHQLEPGGFNPVFEAILGKLVHNAFPFAHLKGRKR
jgi:hypothetical protein